MVETAQQNETEFRWTAVKHRAAALLAEDDLTDQEIADELGVNRITLWRWKQHKEFSAQVGGHVGALQAAMLRLPIAKKRKRLKTLDDLHTKALQVIELRAARYAADADSPAQAARRVFGGQTVPEAATGLLVRDETITASGMTSVKWAFDAALVREIRALEEQAAKELGQWVEKSESLVTGEIRLVGVNAEAL